MSFGLVKKLGIKKKLGRSVPSTIRAVLGFFSSQTSSLEAVGTGEIAYSMPSSGTYTDFQPLVRETVSINEARFEGTRVVYNELDSPNDFTAIRWQKNQITVTKDTLTANNNNVFVVQNNTRLIGEERVFHIDIKRKTGTGNIQLSPNGGVNYTTVPVTSEYQRFSVYFGVSTAQQVVIRIQTSGDAIFVKQAMVEIKTDITNKNPSEFTLRQWQGRIIFNSLSDILAPHLSGSETVVSSSGTSNPSIVAGRINFTTGTCWDLVLSDGTIYALDEGEGDEIIDSGNSNNGTLINANLYPKHYETENGNTVLNNVVTEATGAGISDATLKGILIEPATTNVDDDYDGGITKVITLTAGNWTLSVTGTGSTTTTTGTATGTGFGIATEGNDNTFNLSVGGTVNFTVAGSIDTQQVEEKLFSTSLMKTDGGTKTRSPTNEELNFVAGTFDAEIGISIALTIIPRVAFA